MSPDDRKPDRAVWTRIGGIQGAPLDLLTARIASRHYAPHAHEEYAIGVCTDGREVMSYRGERHYTGPGALVMLEPGEAHTGGPADACGFSYRVFYPSAALLAEGALCAPHFPEAFVRDEELAHELWRTHRMLVRNDDLLEGETRLLELLRALVRRHGSSTKPPGRRASRRGVRLAEFESGERGDAAATRIARTVAERLADELTDPPPLADLAADLGLSRYQLLRAFRDAEGMPPYAWLAQHRVARARALLDAGHRPAEAATLVGFADQAHLTRWFRRVLGVTPGAYRNSVQDSALRTRRS
ncbi:AraC family transcriptional regulator [Actinomadura rudentiformis]|uniref:AraC family transcriptional regulator n=1 Tax=Actinomadura rudentiformis TaxID=359158 RepID=A0A6H9YVD5_9ACTN|nr:AraC family transcriptional regulator [Actinomadura rudentiformis]KAB2344716.1 AraC family transcriptional regulator [Actinomadura rudentiformis]